MISLSESLPRIKFSLKLKKCLFELNKFVFGFLCVCVKYYTAFSSSLNFKTFISYIITNNDYPMQGRKNEMLN